MDNTTKDQLTAKVETLKKEAQAFATAAQEEVNKKSQELQQKQGELQNLVKSFQKEIDRREGAIAAINDLLGVPLAPQEPKVAKKNGKGVK